MLISPCCVQRGGGGGGDGGGGSIGGGNTSGGSGWFGWGKKRKKGPKPVTLTLVSFAVSRKAYSRVRAHKLGPTLRLLVIILLR